MWTGAAAVSALLICIKATRAAAAAALRFSGGEFLFCVAVIKFRNAIQYLHRHNLFFILQTVHLLGILSHSPALVERARSIQHINSMPYLKLIFLFSPLAVD